MGRWLIAVAVLAVLTVVVTIAINMFGGNPRDVQVPDVRGQASADAIAALQNRGFKTRTQQKPDSTVPPDHVIDTEPDADTAVGAGDEITINVSTGPEQREVPDVSALTYAEAVQQAHRRRVRAVQAVRARPSTPEQKDRVLGTIPPANQTSAITNEITIVVGSGPETARVPDVHRPDRRVGAADPHRVRLHQVRAGRGGQHRTRGSGRRHQSARGGRPFRWTR